MIPMLPVGKEAMSFASSKFAPKMAGMPTRKANRPASFRPNPQSKPAAIVAPDLDKPGNAANPCANPTIRAHQ
jgi:hypothetical protein